MAYGDLKVRNLIWNTGSGDNTVVLSTLATQSYVTTNFAPKANPTFSGTINGVDLILSGNLTVSGTQTIINTNVLQVEDKHIEIGKVSSPSDTTADGGGIILKASSDRTFVWINSTDAWTSSEHIQVASGKTFIGDGSTLTALNATNLASGTVPTARLGSGTAGSSNFLRGDGSWQAIATDKIEEGNTSVETVDTGSDGHVKITTEGTERARVDNLGNLSVGGTSPSTQSAKLQAYGTSQNGTRINMHHEGNSSASISANGGLVLSADGANGTTERFRVGTSGQLGIGGATYGSSGQVLTSGGASAAPSWAAVPPGGNTVDLVADGAIAAGKPCIIKTNGKVAQVGESTGASSSASKLNDVQVNTDSTKRHIHVLYDTANDRAVHISSSGDRLMAQCLNVNSDKEVYSKAGNNQEVHSNADNVSACWDSVNDRAVVAFRNTTNKHGYIVVGTFTSASAMSWGTPVEFQDDVDSAFGGGNGTEYMHITHDPSADKFLLFYRLLRSSSNGTFVGSARVITIASNGTVTVGSLHQVSGTNDCYNYHCQNISSNFFAFSYSDGGNGHKPTLKTATISGTSISYGSDAVASTEDTAGQGFGGSDADLAYDSVNQKLIFVHNAHLGSTAPICQARGRVASISGTSISFDAGEDNNIVSSSRRVFFIRLIYDVSTGTTWTCYISDHTADSGYTKIMHIGQCTYDSSATYKLAYAGHIRQPNNLMDACHDLDQMQGPTIIGNSGKCLIPINDDGDTDSSYVLTYSLTTTSTNVTAHNPIGFAPSAISDGNTGTINCDGNTVTTSGLTAGTRYWVQNNGTLGTSAVTTQAGGIALSSSKLLIKLSA